MLCRHFPNKPDVLREALLELQDEDLDSKVRKRPKYEASCVYKRELVGVNRMRFAALPFHVVVITLYVFVITLYAS